MLSPVRLGVFTINNKIIVEGIFGFLALGAVVTTAVTLDRFGIIHCEITRHYASGMLHVIVRHNNNISHSH